MSGGLIGLFRFVGCGLQGSVKGSDIDCTVSAGLVDGSRFLESVKIYILGRDIDILEDALLHNFRGTAVYEHSFRAGAVGELT